jgi:uncharacterized protein YjbJ (UPF0337 family)
MRQCEHGTANHDGGIARNSDIASPLDPTALKTALGNIVRSGQRVGRLPAISAGEVMGINKDQVEGRTKEAAGKVQEVAGKAVGSTTQQVKGAVNKTAGAAQAKYGDIKNDVKSDMDKRDKEQRQER